MSENHVVGAVGVGIKLGAEAMAAAVAIAGGTAVYAEPVRFENDDRFEWRPADCGGQNYLDITMDSGSQLNEQGDTTFSQWYYYGVCNDDDKAGNYMYAGQFFAQAAWVQANGDYGRVDRLEAGYPIGPDSAFGDDTTMSIYSSPCCYANDWGAVGTEGYIGVKFTMGGQTHYGWIKAALTDPRGAQLQALAWGYESSPDTAVPAGAGGEPGCYADLNGDEVLDLFDFLEFTNLFNANDPTADCDGDGEFNLFDFLCFTNAFNEGC